MNKLLRIGKHAIPPPLSSQGPEEVFAQEVCRHGSPMYLLHDLLLQVAQNHNLLQMVLLHIQVVEGPIYDGIEALLKSQLSSSIGVLREHTIFKVMEHLSQVRVLVLLHSETYRLG